MRKRIRDDVQELALTAALDQIIDAAKSLELLGSKVKKVMRETKDAIGTEREIQGVHDSVSGVMKAMGAPDDLIALIDELTGHISSGVDHNKVSLLIRKGGPKFMRRLIEAHNIACKLDHDRYQQTGISLLGSKPTKPAPASNTPQNTDSEPQGEVVQASDPDPGPVRGKIVAPMGSMVRTHLTNALIVRRYALTKEAEAQMSHCPYSCPEEGISLHSFSTQEFIDARGYINLELLAGSSYDEAECKRRATEYMAKGDAVEAWNEYALGATIAFVRDRGHRPEVDLSDTHYATAPVAASIATEPEPTSAKHMADAALVYQFGIQDKDTGGYMANCPYAVPTPGESFKGMNDAINRYGLLDLDAVAAVSSFTQDSVYERAVRANAEGRQADAWNLWALYTTVCYVRQSGIRPAIAPEVTDADAALETWDQLVPPNEPIEWETLIGCADLKQNNLMFSAQRDDADDAGLMRTFPPGEMAFHLLRDWAKETGMMPITLEYLIDQLAELDNLPQFTTDQMDLHERLVELLSEVQFTEVAV